MWGEVAPGCEVNEPLNGEVKEHLGGDGKEHLGGEGKEHLGGEVNELLIGEVKGEEGDKNSSKILPTWGDDVEDNLLNTFLSEKRR